MRSDASRRVRRISFADGFAHATTLRATIEQPDGHARLYDPRLNKWEGGEGKRAPLPFPLMADG